MRRSSLIGLAVEFTAILFYAGIARAAVIDFEDQTGPTEFINAGAAQTLVYNIGGVTVTFSGGVILTDATNLPADETSVYGTASDNFITGASPTLQNPLTVTFSAPIQNFFLDVLNGFTGDATYTLADNAGNSSSFTLVPNLQSGATEIGFAATGTQVTLTSTDPSTDWDFFIDNVHFDEPLPGVSSVPETSPWLGIAIAALAAGGLGLFKRVRMV